MDIKALPKPGEMLNVNGQLYPVDSVMQQNGYWIVCVAGMALNFGPINPPITGPRLI